MVLQATKVLYTNKQGEVSPKRKRRGADQISGGLYLSAKEISASGGSAQQPSEAREASDEVTGGSAPLVERLAGIPLKARAKSAPGA